MRFVPNRNFQNELLRDIKYIAGLADKAAEARDHAKRYAPVRTGAYRDSIEVVTRGHEVYVTAKDFKANWIEFGSVNNPPSAPLRRGAQSAGLKFRADK